KNMCNCERGIRVVVGLFLASMAFWGPQSMWFLLGLIPAASGIVGNCPVYTLLGINRTKNSGSSCCCCCKDKDNT
ncbi:MAG: DUF2892 domain-containing protein, partial [Bdellovibrionales bacterium]